MRRLLNAGNEDIDTCFPCVCGCMLMQNVKNIQHTYNRNTENPEGLLWTDAACSRRISLKSRTDEQHEFMRKEIVQKTADIIYRIRSIDTYALSRVEHNLTE